MAPPLKLPEGFSLAEEFSPKTQMQSSGLKLPEGFSLAEEIQTPGPQPVDMSSDTSDVLPLDRDIPLTGGFLKWKDPINAVGQAGGAVIGAPFAGPTMGLSVLGGAAGGNILTNRVVDKLNQ